MTTTHSLLTGIRGFFRTSTLSALAVACAMAVWTGPASLHEVSFDQRLAVRAASEDVDRATRALFMASPGPKATLSAAMGVVPTGVVPPEVPSNEIILNDALPRVADSDADVQVLGLPDNRVTVLMLEDFRLRALCSTNGGQSFDPEIDVYGAPPENALLAYNAVLLDDGELYVVMVVGDPAGGDRLEVIRSPDAGRTWGSAVVVLSRDAPGSFAFVINAGLRIAATTEGRVAIVTALLNTQSGVAVAVSSDHGSSWTSPLLYADYSFGDVAIDRASGTVYAATMQYIDDYTSRLPGVRKSTDGGVSWGPPVYPADIPAGDWSYATSRVAVLDDGTVILSALFSGSPRSIRIFRSTDGGDSFSTALVVPMTSQSFWFDLHAVTGSLTFLASFQKSSAQGGELRVVRSGDGGLTFDPPQTIASSKVASFANKRIARTASGRWGIVWKDARTGGGGPGVFVRVSADDGQTWGSEKRTTPPIAGAERLRWVSIAATSSDELVVGYADDTRTAGGVGDVYLNRTSASEPSFGPDRRIDTDLGSSRPAATGAVIASDRGSRVYTAFASLDAGPGPDLRLARSGNGGRTFGFPERISTWSPGSPQDARVSAMAAAPDGTVFLAYCVRFAAVAEYDVRVKISSDFGVSWVNDEFIGNSPDCSGFDIDAVPGGTGHLLWSDGSAVSATTLRAWGNGARTTATLQNDIDERERLRICASGSQVAAAWLASAAGDLRRPMASVSTNAGTSFGTAQVLDTGEQWELFDLDAIELDCLPNGKAIAVWNAAFGRVSRLEGETWSAPTQINGGPELLVGPSIAYSDSTGNRLSVVYQSLTDLGLYAHVSTDGGTTFGPGEMLDASLPNPYTYYWVHGVASDRNGHVWVVWGDDGVLLPDRYTYGTSVLVSRSDDFGATFGPPRRLDRGHPIGVFENFPPDLEAFGYYGYDTAQTESLAVLPGALVTVWVGQRDDRVLVPIVNADAIDDADRDGFGAETDCNDGDPTIHPGAAEICNGVDDNCDELVDNGGSALCDDGNPCTTDVCLEGGCANFGGDCVIAVDPPDNATDVSVGTNVTLIYHDPIDPATVTASTFQLFGPNDEASVAATRVVSSSGTHATLDPVEALAPNTIYRVEATSGIDGPGESQAQPFTSYFRTGAGAASTAITTVSETTDPLPTASKGGSSVSAAGDLNGDGVDDFISGAPGYEVAGALAAPSAVEAGAALVYFGSRDDAERAEPDIIFTGVGAHDRTGVSVAGDFDFNGDGLKDIVIGAEQVDRTTDPNNPTPVGNGKVYLIFFDPNDATHYPNIGDPSLPDTVSLSLVGQPGGIPGVVFEGAAFGDQAGFAVAGGGTSTAGGGTDIAIGAPGHDPGGRIDAGAVYVVFDNPDLSGNVSLSRISNGQADQVPGKAYFGAEPGDNLGFSVAFGGDVVEGQTPSTGTVLMGAPSAGGRTGKILVPPGDPDTTPIIVDAIGTTNSGFQIVGTQPGEQLGFAVADGGDALADGVPDLLIGAPTSNVGAKTDAGRVLETSQVIASGVYGADAVGTTIKGVIWTGEVTGDLLGSAVAGVGDVTGDGYDDIVLGAPNFDATGALATLADAGAVYVINGSPAVGYLGTRSVADVGTVFAGQRLTGTQAGEHAGSSIAGTGDISGDGRNDFTVGAPERDDDAGTIYMVLVSAPAAPGNCGPAGCQVVDLATGAQVNVPPGGLTTAVTLGVKGILDGGALPAPPPVGKVLFGAAQFTPDGQSVLSPFATITIPTGQAFFAHLGPGAVLPLFYYDGAAWVPAGIDGTTGPNPSYPSRTAVTATVGVLHVYAVFVNDCPNLDCDDGNCCTIDACSPATGCTHTPITTAPAFVQQPSLGTCAMLWPPQHGYADFTVADTGASATSTCGIASINFVSCNSSQPENGSGVGDGNSTRDCVYEPGAVHLRAERDGACSPIGRVYTMQLIAVDVCGNATTSSPFEVGVWHDRGDGPTSGTVFHGNGGTNDTRNGTNGTYGPGCGPGNTACGEVGQPRDHSDADPEAEISQSASISVNDLRIEKERGGNLRLSWTQPAHEAGINVTRFHIYRLDPATLFWTQIAEVSKQTTSYADPILNDGNDWQYKVTAMIK
jgi:hypothetical protein